MSTSERLSESTEALIEEIGAPASSEEAVRGIKRIDSRLKRKKRQSVEDKSVLLATKAGLLGVLAEFRKADTLDEAELTLKEILALVPEDVVTLTSLAQLHHFQTKKLNVALRWAESGASAADKQSKLVRLAYGVLCRIAITLDRRDLIERSLRRLMEFKPSSPTDDINLEADLVSRIPADAWPPGMQDAYREKLGRNSGGAHSDKDI